MIVGASKILTVSYGTFSCTLEGFDEPFGTMKAIAEYFRDLAAEDRYFGATPPQPDAEMLHRIAEREIQRRVEAKIQHNGVILRQQDDAAAPEPVVNPAIVAAPVAPVAEAAVADESLAAESAPPVVEDRPAAALEEDAIEDPEATPAFVVPAQADPVSESVAAKLQRIRDAVAAARDAARTTTLPVVPVEAEIADEPADQPDAATPTEPEPDTAAEEAPVETILAAMHEDTAEVVEDTPLDTAPVEATTEQNLDDNDTPHKAAERHARREERRRRRLQHAAALRAAMMAEAAPAETETATEAEAEAFPEPAGEDFAPLLLKVDHETADTLEADIAAGDEGAEAETSLSDEDEAALLAELAALSAVPEHTPTELPPQTQADRAEAPEQADDAILAALAAVMEPETAHIPVPEAVTPNLLVLRAKDTSEDTAEEESAPAPLLLETRVPDAVAPEPLAPEIQVAEPLAPETVAVADEPADDVTEAQPDAQGDALAMTEETTPSAEQPAAAIAAFEAEAAPAEAPFAAREASVVEDHFSEEEIAAAEVEAADLPPALPVHPQRPQRATTPAEPAPDVDRLMDKANAQMSGNENRRKFSVLGHLKAAVAATVAESLSGRKQQSEDATRRYREDLTDAVQPRRPEIAATDSPRPERPSTRPAPLVLVSAQRIDAEGAAQPVRPRRVSAADLRRDILDAPDMTPAADTALAAQNAGSFAEFAQTLGTNGLADLLEAAAAYTEQVEGRPHFSPPHIMSKIAGMSAEGDFSREERLRMFGTLLRQGKIAKVQRGQYAITEASQYFRKRA